MLKVNNLTINHNNPNTLNNISFVVNAKTTVSIVCKDTFTRYSLFNVICGNYKNKFSGSIEFLDKDISPLNLSQLIKLGIICIPKNWHVFSTLSIKENIMIGAYAIKSKIKVNDQYKFILEILPHISKLQNSSAISLSSGERMMVALARALISNPKLIVIDASAIAFQEFFYDEFIKITTKLKQCGTSFLFFHSTLEKAVSISDWMYVIEDGEVVKEGDNSAFKAFDSEIIETEKQVGKFKAYSLM